MIREGTPDNDEAQGSTNSPAICCASQALADAEVVKLQGGGTK